MPRSTHELRDDALAIWRAGVDAVRPERLLPTHVSVDGDALRIGGLTLSLAEIRRIVVVGAGKAGGGMVRALETALGPSVLADKQVTGIVNVPADRVAPTHAIELVAARPAGVNEPTAEAVASTRRLIDLVRGLGSPDLCLCLVSGGGSALLTTPRPESSLTEMIALTRGLSAGGATIDQLNAVRRELCAVKGGGLARACRAGRLVTLILSDVMGNDEATIASGPTVSVRENPARAARLLRRFDLHETPVGKRAVEHLERRAAKPMPTRTIEHDGVTNLVIGTNAMAVDAAGAEAKRLGYRPVTETAAGSEGPVEEVADRLADAAVRMRDGAGPDCLVSGGEPTVRLAPASERGLGGRNQQLALAALARLGTCRGIALLSGGTDGEDGPTDAAGACIDEQVAQRATARRLDVDDHLSRSDAYRFFEQAGGLIRTGPTDTNVCDLRVVVTAPIPYSP